MLAGTSTSPFDFTTGTLPVPAVEMMVISTVAVVAVTPPTLSLFSILPVTVAVVIGANTL